MKTVNVLSLSAFAISLSLISGISQAAGSRDQYGSTRASGNDPVSSGKQRVRINPPCVTSHGGAEYAWVDRCAEARSGSSKERRGPPFSWSGVKH